MSLPATDCPTCGAPRDRQQKIEAFELAAELLARGEADPYDALTRALERLGCDSGAAPWLANMYEAVGTEDVFRSADARRASLHAAAQRLREAP